MDVEEFHTKGGNVNPSTQPKKLAREFVELLVQKIKGVPRQSNAVPIYRSPNQYR